MNQEDQTEQTPDSKLRRKQPKQTEESRSEEAIDQECLAEAQSIWQYLKLSRRRAELEWFINEQAHDNNQFLYYNTATRALQPVTTENRRDKVTINRVKQQTRSIISYLNQRKPFVQTLPASQGDDAYLRSRKTKNLCDDWYDRLEMNKKNKKISRDGVIRGLGWSKISWSNDALSPTAPFSYKGEQRTKQYGEVTFEHCDTFDVYPDPLATEKSDLRYIAHAIPRTMGDLKNDKRNKNTDKLTSDRRLAASDLKQVQLRQTLGGSNGNSGTAAEGDGDLQTVVVIELFYRKWNEEKNEWGIYLVTMSDGGVLLRREWWALDEFPFEPFIADITSAMLRSKGTVHDIRDPNRAVNDLVSQTLEAARVMGKLNWVMPRGSNVNVITDETGQFIEYDMTPGGRPEQAQPAGVPTYIPNLVSYLDNAIMDIGGSHDTSMGKNAFAGASGELVKSLQAGDASTLAMLRDNFDDFLIRSFKLMLKTAKHFGNTKRVVRGADADEFGQYAWTQLDPDDISLDDDIRVKSGSNLPFTADERQNFFLAMWDKKLIQDPNAILKLLDIPDVVNVLGDDEMDIERELDNIKTAQKGKPIPPPLIGEKHEVHISTLDKFMRSEKFLKLKPEAQQEIQDHRSKHVDISINLHKIQMLNQYEPIKRTEQIRVNVDDMKSATPQERAQLFEQFNAQSDAFEIQRRGGLVVQNPADAEIQAQNEDMDLMDGKPVQISLGDNHIVHLQTHNQIVESPHFQTLPPQAQKAFNDHITEHEQALAALQPAPGLVPKGAQIAPMNPQGPGPQAPGPQGPPLPPPAPAHGPMNAPKQA